MRGKCSLDYYPELMHYKNEVLIAIIDVEKGIERNREIEIDWIHIPQCSSYSFFAFILF